MADNITDKTTEEEPSLEDALAEIEIPESPVSPINEAPPKEKNLSPENFTENLPEETDTEPEDNPESLNIDYQNLPKEPEPEPILQEDLEFPFEPQDRSPKGTAGEMKFQELSEDDPEAELTPKEIEEKRTGTRDFIGHLVKKGIPNMVYQTTKLSETSITENPSLDVSNKVKNLNERYKDGLSMPQDYEPLFDSSLDEMLKRKFQTGGGLSPEAQLVIVGLIWLIAIGINIWSFQSGVKELKKSIKQEKDDSKDSESNLE